MRRTAQRRERRGGVGRGAASVVFCGDAHMHEGVGRARAGRAGQGGLSVIITLYRTGLL